MCCRLFSAAVAGALLAGACTSPTMTLPEGFLELRDERDFKATTADDARLWLRDFEDRDRGTLEFWINALSNDLVEHRGYRPLEQLPVRDQDGNEGIEMRFATQLEGVAHGYLIAVFVIESGSSHTIRVLEFLAERPRFDELVGPVHQAIATLGSK